MEEIVSGGTGQLSSVAASGAVRCQDNAVVVSRGRLVAGLTVIV